MADDETPSDDEEHDPVLASALKLLYQLHPLMADLEVACLVAHAVMTMIADQHGPGAQEMIHALSKPTKARRKEDTRAFIDDMKRRGVFSSYEQAAQFIMSPEGTQTRKRFGLQPVQPESFLRNLAPSRTPKKPPDKKR